MSLSPYICHTATYRSHDVSPALHNIQPYMCRLVLCKQDCFFSNSRCGHWQWQVNFCVVCINTYGLCYIFIVRLFLLASEMKKKSNKSNASAPTERVTKRFDSSSSTLSKKLKSKKETWKQGVYLCFSGAVQENIFAMMFYSFILSQNLWSLWLPRGGVSMEASCTTFTRIHWGRACTHRWDG